MENHGGKISATSLPGKGSIFTLEFPKQKKWGELIKYLSSCERKYGIAFIFLLPPRILTAA